MTSEDLAKRAEAINVTVRALCEEMAAAAADENAEDQGVAFGALCACSTILDMVVANALNEVQQKRVGGFHRALDALVADGLLEVVKDEES